jgi:transglutaminase-like putative cysteine protease
MRLIPLVIFCTLTLPAFSQKESSFTKFGKISASTFATKVYPIDSSANAVVLSDIGSASLEGNSKGWFSLVTRKHKVVHILNKNGYDEANVEIHLYTNGSDEEKLDKVKAVTYNLENGKVVETSLEKSAVFKEKINKNRVVKKFTMPNVKEGSIIEFDYQVTSDYIGNLDPWLFQSTSSPTLWSEFVFSVPEFFSYNFLSRGFHGIDINERKDRTASFTVRQTQTASSTESFNFNAGVTDFRWVMKDVPELKTESFTSSIMNHISRMEFQLASKQYPLEVQNYRTSWTELTKGLLQNESFGSILNNSNNWLSDDIKPVYASVNSGEEKARKLYNYVRDNFSCTGKSGYIYMDQSLKNVLKTKKGTVAEINLLLTTMLRYSGLDATPVILSTTKHGYAIEYSPMTSSFDYVIVQLKDNGRVFYLDASDNLLGFNKLPLDCYNGHARVVNETADAVHFSPDSLTESKTTLLIINNDENGKWKGRVSQTPGYYGSYDIREKVKDKGKEEFFKEVEKAFGLDIKILSPSIDSLKNYETPVALHYDVEFLTNGESTIYVNPMFGEGYKKNLFTAAERYYPVEMPYTMDETFVLSMEVPKGYEVDELPKQMIAKVDEEGSGLFEYRISNSQGRISFRCRIKFNRSLYLPEEYPNLREFFNMVVSKQSEQIVLKKKI